MSRTDYGHFGGDRMDINAVTTFITTLGFPVACVVYLFYSNQKERDVHHEESKSWMEALHNNTLALTKLTDIIKDSNHDQCKVL